MEGNNDLRVSRRRTLNVMRTLFYIAVKILATETNKQTT